MKITINIKGQAECPSCGSWNDLIPDTMSIYYYFICCGRNFIVSITKENLEKFRKGGKVDPPDPNWFVYE